MSQGNVAQLNIAWLGRADREEVDGADGLNVLVCAAQGQREEQT
jgi:hypothetical protein